ARGSSVVLRIALIYFLLDPPSRRKQGIQPVHLDAAMAVWKYCEQSVQFLFGDRARSKLGDKLLELLDNPMTKTEINEPLSPKQKGESIAALDSLVNEGKVRKEKLKRSGAGAPATVYQRI